MTKLSRSISVLMVGVSNPPSTFLARQVSALTSLGARVRFFPESAVKGYAANALAYRGIYMHVPREARALFRDVDLIHFQWPGHLLTYYPLARRANKPVVVSLRGRQINIIPYLPTSSGFVKRLRSTLPLCDAYHCVSENIMREAEAWGLEPKRAFVIRPAVDTTFFVPNFGELQDEPVNLLMIGSLIWRKGYDYALLATRRLVEMGFNIRLTIVGDGREREWVEYTIQDLGLNDYVHLTGRLQPLEVLELLHSSHIFLHTGLSEGIANAVLEAMACGLPVVSFLAGGMKEVIDNGKDGFLVQPRDVDGLTQYVSELVRHPELRRKIGIAARHKIQDSFELKVQGQDFLNLYMRVLEQ